tara:strand:- start:19 stop:516 length:498 start_codon:yes stop_codon:yes gene_type:complete
MLVNNFSHIGPKIKKKRQSLGYSQSELSKKLGISASYLNLIENGRRKLTTSLTTKVGLELGISQKEISRSVDEKLLLNVIQILNSKLFESADISNDEINEFTTFNPKIAEAFITLYNEYLSTNNNIKKISKSIKVKVNQEKNNKYLSINNNEVHYSERYGWTLKK